MGKGRKQKSKRAAAKPSGNGVAHAPSKGKTRQLDEKLARAIARRIKKLRRELTEVSRLEAKRVRALDKAHRRRQLIESALDELSLIAPASAAAAVAEPVPATPASPNDAAPLATSPAPAPAARTSARKPSTRRKAVPPQA